MKAPKPKTNSSVPAKTATVRGKQLPPGAALKRTKAAKKALKRNFANPNRTQKKTPGVTAKNPLWAEVGSRMPAGKGTY